MYTPKGYCKMSKIGCDILRIKRIEDKLKDEKFLERFFSDNEIKMFNERNIRVQTVTGNFCANEAYVQALGCGFGKIRPKDVEVLRNENGVPYILHNGNKYSTSISHDGEYAFAVVVLEE